MPGTSNGLLDAALEYIARGWRIFPAHEMNGAGCSCGEADCASPGKHPRTDHGHHDASADRAKIENWWGRWPNASIAIATGRESNLSVVDADASAGKPGINNLTTICGPHGGLPSTLIAESGGGGLHLYFAYCERLATGTNVLAEAVDVRSDGGYIIAPPSGHASGRRYKWQNGLREVADAPEWLVPAALQPRARKRTRRASPKEITLEQAQEMLAHVDPDDRDRWLKIGIVLGRAFNSREEAWSMYEAWSARSQKFADDRAGNLARMREMFFEKSKEEPRGDAVTVGSLWHWAEAGGWEPMQEGVAAYEKFWSVRPAGKFLYAPSGALWAGRAVDDALPPRFEGVDVKGRPIHTPASVWLGRNRAVNSMVFDPALPQVVEDRVAREQGVIEDVGSVLFNTYFPPRIKRGDSAAATPWVEHVRRLFPTTAEADHIVRWLAHRVQRPGEKVRHALVLGGPQGIGKDTVIDAVVPALGEWNTQEISPDRIFSAFNEFTARVLIRISEVADLHEVSRFKFFEATKTLIAGTLAYTEVNPKYGTKFFTRNCAGVVMTTNYIDTGLHLSPDDRRHFAVQTVELWGTAEERAAYFQRLWDWLLTGDGFSHVAAYLHAVPLDDFNPNRPPPKTDTWHRIVSSSKGSDSWLLDALDRLREPKMVRADTLRSAITTDDLTPQDISNRLGAAMARTGYELHRNITRADGRHNFEDTDPMGQTARRTTVVYVKRDAPAAERPTLFAGLRGPGF